MDAEPWTLAWRRLIARYRTAEAGYRLARLAELRRAVTERLRREVQG